MRLTVNEGSVDINDVWIARWAIDTLVVPALAGAEIVGCITFNRTRIGRIRTRLIDKDRRAGLHHIRDKEPAIRSAAVTFSLINARIRIWSRHDSNFAAVGTGIVAGVNICPSRAVVV